MGVRGEEAGAEVFHEQKNCEERSTSGMSHLPAKRVSGAMARLTKGATIGKIESQVGEDRERVNVVGLNLAAS